MALAPLLAACGTSERSTSTPTSAPAAAPTTAKATGTTVGFAPPSRSVAAIVRSATWSGTAAGKVGSDTYTITSNGVPPTGMQAKYPVPIAGVTVPTQPSQATLVDNPTKAYDLSVTLPSTPTWSGTVTPTPLATIGVIIDGAALFNPYEANNSTVALQNNFQIDGFSFVDSCNGHPTPPQAGAMYHYHGVPTCITSGLDGPGGHSAVVGFAYDGYPIYGPQGVDGRTPTDLDDCSGHFGPTPELPDGVYHYHLTTSFPFSLPCFHGTVSPGLLSSMPHPPPPTTG